VKEPFLSVIELHSVNDITQIDTHTVEPLVSEYGALDVETTVNKFKRYKVQLLIKLQHVIHAEGNTFDFLFSLLDSSLQYKLRRCRLLVQRFIK
jgi:hypothetical protein